MSRKKHKSHANNWTRACVRINIVIFNLVFNLICELLERNFFNLTAVFICKEMNICIVNDRPILTSIVTYTLHYTYHVVYSGRSLTIRYVSIENITHLRYLCLTLSSNIQYQVYTFSYMLSVYIHDFMLHYRYSTYIIYTANSYLYSDIKFVSICAVELNMFAYVITTNSIIWEIELFHFYTIILTLF